MAGSDLEYITKQELELLLRGGIPAARIQKARPSARRLIVRSIFNKWVVFYGAFMYDKIQLSETTPRRLEQWLSEDLDARTRKTLTRMNSGDCGTTAIAVGQVLEQLGFEVEYWDNDNHGFILVDGLFYDTLTANGQTAVDQMYGHSAKLSSGNLAFMHDAFLRVDPLGVRMVETFVRMFVYDYKYPYPVAE